MQRADTITISTPTLFPLQRVERRKPAQKRRSLDRSNKLDKQSSLPFSEPLVPKPLNQQKSCIFNNLEVKYPYSFEEQKAPPVAVTTDEADQPNVVAHVEAESLLIVQQPPKVRQGCAMEARQLRGLEIAAQHEIVRDGNVWLVPSQSSFKRYTVNLFIQTCTCADFDAHRIKCKHIHAAEAALRKESGLDVAPLPEKRIQRTYKQQWEAYNLAQTNEKAKFQELLHELCRNIEDMPRKAGPGRNRLPLGEMIFAVCFKVYSLVSSRRFISDLREAERKGYISKTPHFNSIFNYLEMKEMTAHLKNLIIESSLPLRIVEENFAIDSSGFSTGRYDRWVDTKWDKGERKYTAETKSVNMKDWLKAHVMCGCQSNIVTDVEVTDSTGADISYFEPLVKTTAENFVMNTVVADKAYSSNETLKLVVSKSAMPYIPFKSNSTGNNTRNSSVWNRMYHYFMYNQDEFMRHYHKRSNVESTFSMIKAKFGERLRSKTETAQKNEVLCKILCHNICCVIQSIYELGIEPSFCDDFPSPLTKRS